MICFSHFIEDKVLTNDKIYEMFRLDINSLPLCRPLSNTLQYINKNSQKERLKKNENIDFYQESIKNNLIYNSKEEDIINWINKFYETCNKEILESYSEKTDIYLNLNKKINSPTFIQSSNDTLCVFFFDLENILLMVSVFRNYNKSPPIKEQKFILLGLINNSETEKNKLIHSIIMGLHSFHSNEKDKLLLFENSNVSTNLLFYGIPLFKKYKIYEIIGSILYAITNNLLTAQNTKFIER